MKRLAVIVSHPIQHFSPWFQAMAAVKDLNLHVFYGSRHGAEIGLDTEFGQEFAWDIPLLEGYEFEFIKSSTWHAGINSGFFGLWMHDLFRRFRDFQPHAMMILGWHPICYWQAAYYAIRMGIPYFIRGESNLLRRGGPIRWNLKRLTIGRLCRRAACCLAIGTRNANLYEAYGVSRTRIRMAPYFVDNERFENLAMHLRPRRVELRQAFGLPREGTVFLFVGKFIPKKHPQDLLSAYLSLPLETRNRASLLFVGDGALRETVQKIAVGCLNVRFAGFLNQSKMPEAYAASDVIVLPSDSGETWGLAVNEAMASGLPAIVSDQVGCAPDLVLNDKTGFVVPFGDIAGLTEIMNRLISHPDLIPKLGQEAKSHVQNFSIKRCVNEVIAALEEVVEKA